MKWEPSTDFWRHRKVAVTGGTGFLGSHVVSQLRDLEADVVVVVRDDIAPGSGGTSATST
jgi:nucleoside-diphosphate-sugar epimerase